MSRILILATSLCHLGGGAVHVVENLPPDPPAHATPSVRDLYRDVLVCLEYPATGRNGLAA